MVQGSGRRTEAASGAGNGGSKSPLSMGNRVVSNPVLQGEVLSKIKEVVDEDANMERIEISDGDSVQGEARSTRRLAANYQGIVKGFNPQLIEGVGESPDFEGVEKMKKTGNIMRQGESQNDGLTHYIPGVGPSVLGQANGGYGSLGCNAMVTKEMTLG
ncbi:enoyl-CoA hydratase [Corchorus olitorius]|uniref:Enoyl-CoA hydratase n=1 Tax=Corchorus olitorius TaxID=93759 RepID=A0A1R3KFY5_9ROSI|nr:enoyl-CoA hydratase [Corchorus olitorius]